jgi:transcription elongation factor Elf1
MGRHKQFKMKETSQQWSEDVKCPLCGKETKAQDVKVFGTGTGRQLLALKCGHRLFH